MIAEIYSGELFFQVTRLALAIPLPASMSISLSQSIASEYLPLVILSLTKGCINRSPYRILSSAAISCLLRTLPRRVSSLAFANLIASHHITSHFLLSSRDLTCPLVASHVTHQTRDDMEHIALMERCIGPFPFSLIDRSKRSKDYFHRCSTFLPLPSVHSSLLYPPASTLVQLPLH
jgi:hypothetical protein